MESVQPIETNYLPPSVVARLSGGMEMDVRTTAERTLMTVGAEEKRQELLAVLRSSGIATLE